MHLGELNYRSPLIASFSELAHATPGLEMAMLAGGAGDDAVTLPCIVYHGGRSAGAEAVRLAVFAVLHGDEPAGATAILQLLESTAREPEFFRGVELFCYPICNPDGFADGTRCNRAGADLNREFWKHSRHPEVQVLEQELRSQQFDGLVALHADCDSPGLYAFARGPVTSEELVAPALAAGCGVLPRNTDATIDGFTAEHGVIRDCYPGVLSPPPEQSPAPFEIILETPGRAPLAEQARAAYCALRGLIAELPRLSIGGAGI